jgi:uncharacterized delta-60 repeat protein
MRTTSPFVIVAALAASAVHALEPDPTFGHRGIVTEYRLSGVSGVAVLPDGRILMARSGGSFGLLGRYERDGSPDESFGVGGIIDPPLPIDTRVRGIALQPDGRIVIGGSTTGGELLVARLLTDGALDPSFAGAGFVTTAFPGVFANAAAMALLGDGRIVVAGTVGYFTPIPFEDYAAARFLPDGSLDASFGSAGRVVLDLGGRLPEFVQGMAVQPDGRIVLAGLTGAPAGNGCGMARLLENGSLDPSFGVGGMLFPHDIWDCKAVAVPGEDGRLLIAGASKTSGLLMRLQPDGSFDPTFGNGGIVLTDSDLAPSNAIAIDSRGRIVLASEAYSDAALARLLPDGSPDRSVGAEGWIRCGLGGGPPHYTARGAALAILPGGPILLGVDQTVFSSQAALVKYVEGDASAIPTLSEIATLLFAAFLGLAGILAIRRAA